ncbi:MAG: transposase [Algicola sp.]|nr:transposase [Algicola sp.]
MPRPLRIEYENAIYHVMNRGRGHQFIFHHDDYYHAFLETLGEACSRFGSIVHAYCLMGNHYHLLIQTPLANLSRVMRHIDGVYTQRYNRLKRTDGPLFRGRYKPIIVSHDAYFLQVSRYIHRNPIETKTPLVERLENYIWSSYPNYVGQHESFDWLDMSLTRQLLGTTVELTTSYREFVKQGNDEETVKFHKSGKIGAVFGSEVFKSWVYDDLMPQLKIEKRCCAITPNLTIDSVIVAVADFYQVERQDILFGEHGRVEENLPRKVALYLCQELTGGNQAEIAEVFNLGHYCSVGRMTHEVRTRKQREPQLGSQIQEIIKKLVEVQSGPC